MSDGDLVLGWKWVTPKVGDIVVAQALQRPLIKRITRIDGEGVWLEGDNSAASTDSRQLGHCNRRDLIAKMIIKF